MAQLAKPGPAVGPCNAPPRVHSRGHANWTSQLSLGPGHRPLVQVNVPRSLKEAWEGKKTLSQCPGGFVPYFGSHGRDGAYRQVVLIAKDQNSPFSILLYRKKSEPCPTRSQLNSQRKTAANVYREVLWATPCSKSMMLINSIHSHHSLVREELGSCPFCGWANRGTARLVTCPRSQGSTNADIQSSIQHVLQGHGK